MSFREPHSLHKRRFGLNLGLGLVLAFLVAVVFGLTVAKVSVGGFQKPQSTVGVPIAPPESSPVSGATAPATTGN